MLRIGSLFSGIGGLELGLEWSGLGKTVWQVERDDYCLKVLAKHWPEVRRYTDVREVHGNVTHTEQSGLERGKRNGSRERWEILQGEQHNGNEMGGEIGCTCGTSRKGQPEREACPSCLEPVDLICGGFPCQPFSLAGKRKGKEDDRHLWPEYLRIVRELRPSFVIGENVPGIINMELDTVLSDLESEGYEAITFIIPACGVDAPHKRDRVFVLAHTRNNQGWDGQRGSFGGNGTGELDKGQWSTETIKVTGSSETSGFIPNSLNTRNRTSEYEPDGSRQENTSKRTDYSQPESGGHSKDVADTKGSDFERQCHEGQGQGESGGCGCRKNTEPAIWTTEPELGRVANGIPSRMDRLKCLGNAVVPQVSMAIGMILKQWLRK